MFLRVVTFFVLISAALYLAPALIMHAVTPIERPEAARPVEAALIFGALVRDGSISPLHRERLDAARSLYEQGKAKVLVVSNQARAASVMQSYLEQNGVPKRAIEWDGAAERTPQTCAAEAAKAARRTVAYISQRFHLPRIAMQCAHYDLDASFVMADSPNRAPSPLATKIRVRSTRFLREAGLMWGHILRLYPAS